MTPKILITGKNGQVGWELQRTMATLGEVIAVDRQGIDLANPDSIRAVMRAVRPSLIVNAAAYTAVDKAESEPELAMAINGVAPGIMAEEAKALSAALVHYSTDYVFDGTKAGPYSEDDVPNPINVYGKTKLAGERAVQAAGVPHLIFRTSWVYGLRGKNFLLTMLKLAKERDQLSIVDDQIGAPTWSRMIAEATAQACSRNVYREIPDWPSGIYHLAASGHASWFRFAKAILAHAPESRCALKAIPSEQYPVPAERPKNSVLSTEKLSTALHLYLPSWERGLELCISGCADHH